MSSAEDGKGRNDGEQDTGGKTALITCGGSGMGKYAARLLAKDGARVVVVRRLEEVIVAAREELRLQAPGATTQAFPGDGSDGPSMRAMVNFAYGLASRLDIIFNSIGDRQTYKTRRSAALAEWPSLMA